VGKVLRTERESQVIENPWNGHRIVVCVTEVVHYFEHGAIRTEKTVLQCARQCACLKPPVGFCAQCDMLCCASCFGRCDQCQKPLCSSCGPKRHDASGATTCVCVDCRGQISRKRIIRGFLAPLVEFDS
jgi:hypothetical protein